LAEQKGAMEKLGVAIVKERKLKIVLIGCGCFGYEYYKELIKFEQSGLIELANVVTESGQSDKVANKKLLIKIDDFLKKPAADFDALIIATPKETHAELLHKFYRDTKILIEKPIVTNVPELESIRNLVAVASDNIVPSSIFRYVPEVVFSRKFLNRKDRPISVTGEFVNQYEDENLSGDHRLEMIHLFDIVDYIYRDFPGACWSDRLGKGLSRVSLIYNSGMIAKFTMGFNEISASKRWIKFQFEWGSYEINFKDNLVIVKNKNGEIKKKVFKKEKVALNRQIGAFLDYVKFGRQPKASLEDSLRVCDTVINARGFNSGAKYNKKRPKVAVVGGGIFGVNCAIELAKFSDVQLYEKNKDILYGATLNNQWRHHMGFHYPLSFETIKEINETRSDFEKVYGDAIDYDVPSYYCVSSYGKEITAERYLAACNAGQLEYKIVPPPRDISIDSVSICLKTNEGIYDIEKMRDISWRELNKSGSITVNLGTEILDGGYLGGTKKHLNIGRNEHVSVEAFDFVVDCTYSNWNRIGVDLGLESFSLRKELVEIVEIELDVDISCLTIIDGPFLSLTYSGKSNKYFLSHRDHSLLKRSYSHDRFGKFRSNHENILAAGAQYIPILSKAKYVGSWISEKAITAYSNETWERPTVIKNHGFGYWSVLGGKILTSVSNSIEISEQIKNSQGVFK